jgi:chromosome segregation ATPase
VAKVARHPEVKESEIVKAGMALEASGKIPNPGAIRAQLCFRGGLLRIKTVWSKFIDEREQSYLSDKQQQLQLEALPTEISDNMGIITNKLTESLERLTVQAYQIAQEMFEKRLNANKAEFEAKAEYFDSYEKEIDLSIEQSEIELRDCSAEAKTLAAQNATLIVENANLKGQIQALQGQIDKLELKCAR